MIEVEENQIVVDEWVGCYRGGWKGVICDQAFQHPAKVAFNLAKRIYEHAIDEDWIKAGDCVVDPFGGIGGCAFHGLMNGMRVVTCELEQKFVDLQIKNRDLWREQYTGLKGFNADNWIILQGDSRNLASVIGEAACSLSSPPYIGSVNSKNNGIDWDKAGRPDRTKPSAARISPGVDAGLEYGESEGQLGAMRGGDLTCVISSPPYVGALGNAKNYADPEKAQADSEREFMKFATPTYTDTRYGTEDGQLGQMPEGDISLAVSSPPFPQPYTSGGGINVEGYKNDKLRPGSEEKPFDLVGKRTYQGRGGDRAEGNLETLETGSVDLAITSPPYNPPMSQDHNGSRGGKRGTEPSETGAFVKYGNSEGQIEGLSMEGFDVAISSPPYTPEALGHRGAGTEIDARKGLHARCNDNQYGEEAGQLSQMKTGGFDAAISSPPHEHDSEPHGDLRPNDGRQSATFVERDYGAMEGNVSASPDTFWSASRTILEQLYSVLTPGAHAIFIVKAFVRNKQIVDFPGQWAQLCEAVGFKLIHDHHAMLTEHSGTQGGMFGEDKEYKVKRVSFFRRLHEKRAPETEIFYENVLCFEKQERV